MGYRQSRAPPRAAIKGGPTRFPRNETKERCYRDSEPGISA
jgi:hypothetical protein